MELRGLAVEESEQEGHANSFFGEPVGVLGTVALQQAINIRGENDSGGRPQWARCHSLGRVSISDVKANAPLFWHH